MDSHAIDSVAGSCSIIGLNATAINHSPLAVRDERARPTSMSSAGPDIMISLVLVPSKDIQDHPLAGGTMVLSEIIARMTTAQGQQQCRLNTTLLAPATIYTTFHLGKCHVFFKYLA